MKKSIKKYLILALVVVAIVVTSVCVASAANEKYYCGICEAQISSTSAYVYPSCNSEGYTEVKCPRCGFVFLRKDFEPATGHNMSEGSYEPVKNTEDKVTHYELVKKCENGDCSYTENDGQKYYKFEFINPYGEVTAYEDYAIAKIPAAYKAVTLFTVYRPATTDNHDPVIINGLKAVRPGDKACGKYNFKGWAKEGEEYGYLDVVVPVAPEADNKYHAIFKEDPSVVKYQINFYSDKGYLIEQLTKTVDHGNVIDDFDNITWDKADDINYRYSFAGWVWNMNGEKVAINKNFEFYGAPTDSNVINLQATYTGTPKEYLFSYYYDEACTDPIFVNGKEAQDTVTLVVKDLGSGKKDKLYPVNGLALSNSPVDSDKKLHGYKDLYNNYVFTGKWIIFGNNGRVLDLNNMNLTGLLDTQQNKDGYTLYPQYEPITRLYNLEIMAYFGTTGENHDEEVTITITDTDGNYIDSVTLEKPDEDGFYRYTAKVSYAARYNVSVVSESFTGYVISAKGEAQAPSSAFDKSTEEFSVLKVELKLNEKGDCDCICHGFLQPVVVKIYNIINSLFKKKIVCCDDMYATIGHKLNYKY